MYSKPAGEISASGTAAGAAGREPQMRNLVGASRTGQDRPRVLLLGSELEDYTIAFANGLSAHADTMLGVPRRQFEGLAHEFDSQVDLRLLDWPRHRSLSNPKFLVALSRLVRRERPDLIHLLGHTIFWLNAAIPFWRPVPVVVTVHDVDRHPGDTETQVMPEWSSRLAVRQADRVVVHGPGLRRRAESRYRKPGDRVHVLRHPAITRYAGLADRHGLTREPARDGLTILMFGRMFLYKGLSDLLQAEAFIGGSIPRLQVVIAGRGDDPWALRDLMGDPARYDIRQRYLPDREVAQLFLNADIVALPYREASQSGVLHIAAAFGRPVIATNVGELGPTVAENGLGLVVPPGDPRRLADAIVTLAGKPQLLAECSEAAMRWSRGRGSADATGAEAAALYREIIGRGAAHTWNVSANAAGGSPLGGRRDARADAR